MEQTFNAEVHGGVAKRDYYSFPEATHVQVVQHFHAAREGDQGSLPKLGTVQQRQLLIDLVAIRPNDAEVFDYMDREFGTRKVNDLTPAQVRETSRHVQAVRAGQLAEPRPTAQQRMNDLQERLSQVRADLWRNKVAFYVNWPSVLLVLGCTALGGYMLWSLLTMRWLHVDVMKPPALMAMMLTTVGLAWWLDSVRRPLKHVLAHLRTEAQELERAVALGRAGRW